MSMKAIKRITGGCLTISLLVITSTSSVYADHDKQWTMGGAKSSSGDIRSGTGEVVRSESSLQEVANIDRVIHEAEKAVKMARKAGFEWRDSGKILKQADKAAAEGNVEKAISLAMRAKQQGEAALAQAKTEANAGPRFGQIMAKIESAERLLSEAKVENKKAAKMGFEWRDTGKIMKQAVKASADMHYDKAIKLAMSAKNQAIAAQAQAIEQQNAGPRF